MMRIPIDTLLEKPNIFGWMLEYSLNEGLYWTMKNRLYTTRKGANKAGRTVWDKFRYSRPGKGVQIRIFQVRVDLAKRVKGTSEWVRF